MDWKTYRKQLLKDPAVRKAYEKTRIEYQIADALISARLKNNLTQKELARRLKTKQSVISRVENARTTPTVSFLERLAAVLGTKLTISFD